ncbi:hypothetical protein V8E36_005261 [Tilletia maclaganii]
MHSRVVLPIVALLFTWAGTTYAKSEGPNFEGKCRIEADRYYPRVPGPYDHPKEWVQYYHRCLQNSWARTVTDDKCPYRDVSCLCYNGCVKASWRGHEDVGAYCHGQCKPPEGSNRR